ncbi:MAG: efflux RND transporter periplasmic adaptor subunit [Acidobacteria bacterium]|nr:efflux RND transporter periplasmic adaptor subunit [Acidobacteriota bacterium]MDA1236742.1 efflux RND transporter periplasmic adaptor subunit [Acidobacteriota bacterium]
MRILILAALALLGCGAPDQATEPQVVVDVKTAIAAIQDVEEIASAPATVFAKSEAKVASQLTAPIASLEVQKGDRVRQGQILARLRTADLDAQLADARAQVGDASANLEKVSSGTLPTEVERAQGEVERTASALVAAKQIFERRQILVAEGALPERDLLIAKTQYDQALSANRVAQSSRDLLTGTSRLQDVRIAESRLASAQAKLDLASAQLAFAEIVSPSPGVVTDQFLYPGDMARPDAPLFTVMDLSVAVARGQFPEERAGGLRVGQACRFTGVDASSVVHQGKLTVVNQAVDLLRRTIEVWCEIPNSGGAVKAGVFGELTVVLEVHYDALTVPLAAVEFDPGRKNGIVWTVGPDNLVHENNTKVGVVSDAKVEILEGVRSGDTVVVEGGYGLSDGLTVRLAEPPQ